MKQQNKKDNSHLNLEERTRLTTWAVVMLIGGITSWISYDLVVGPPYNSTFILPWLVGLAIAFIGTIELYLNAKKK